jgi:hypothetical protein
LICARGREHYTPIDTIHTDVWPLPERRINFLKARQRPVLSINKKAQINQCGLLTIRGATVEVFSNQLYNASAHHDIDT